MAAKAFKYRIYPNGDQATLISKTVGCCRLVYNNLVTWWNDSNKKDENGNWVKHPPLPKVTDISHKPEYSFMDEVDSLGLANARINFQTAVKNYFDSRTGKRDGKKVGKPTYKSKHKSKWVYKTNSQSNTIRFDEDCKHIKLPKLGWVKVVYHRPIMGVIKSATVEKTRSDKYYVTVLVEYTPTDIPQKKTNKPRNEHDVVGLDMSMSEFLVSSDSLHTIPKYARNYRKEEQRIKRLSRRKDKKVKGSKNREKARVKLAKLHEKVANRRHEYIVQTARYIAERYDVIVIEDINMQDMSRTLHLGKSVMDLGWGEFRTWLGYEADKFGGEVIKADKWYASSKLCNHCGSKNTQLQLSDREWVCGECGAIIDRDYNAACNLRDYYIKGYNTVATTGIEGCGDIDQYTEGLSVSASRVSEAASPSL